MDKDVDILNMVYNRKLDFDKKLINFLIEQLKVYKGSIGLDKNLVEVTKYSMILSI